MQENKVELLLPIVTVGALGAAILACCYAPQAKIKRKKLGSKVDRVLDRMSEKRKHSRKARDGDGDDGEYGTTDRLRDDDDRPMV